ncbi:unnamed protein product [Didymodactylos carnosus]|uniref:Ion transport domain-containing protein n=1 Tax=Didymodactylos carnosus TaxID=1234261 RepID=A0A813V0I7_9BILA|nr:unnamed protein product [Didymodactylos carnosus]CAF0921680.1 unnamed protein product [Didymodactylos carnosus]CAF3616977.1 unnamed protein product [Didymodactylos carnosus]CAF3699084.1 unnamed protein product [Didymodactylos carnosus]
MSGASKTPLNSKHEKEHKIRSFFTHLHRRFSSFAEPGQNAHKLDFSSVDLTKSNDTSQFTLTDTLTSQSVSSVTNAHNEDICLFRDSPYYIVRIAGTGNEEEFDRLVHDDPGKLRISNASGCYAIHNAAARNKVAILTIIAQYKGDINLPDKNSWTPLHHAVIHSSLLAIEWLLDNGADSTKKTIQNEAPIHFAVIHNQLASLKILLSKRPDDVNIDGDRDATPLHYAALHDNLEAARILDDLSTPAHLACAQGSLELLKLMLDCQPELKEKVIHMSDVQGMTCLHRAAMFDHVDIMAYLLEMNANINARDNQRRTPLLLAALENSLTAVCFLLSKNASIIARDVCDRNLLHFIIIQGLNFEAIEHELFSRRGYHALFDQRDVDGFYPIHYASRDGQVTMLRILIKYGSNTIIYKKTHKRQSSLHFAAQYGRYNTCKQLLDIPGFERILNEQEQTGLTPLHLSCQNGHTRVVQLLLHKGAMLSRSYDGNNPLHEAAANGHVNTVKLILQSHSHLKNIKNYLGMTLLHCAACNGHVDTVVLLLSNNCDFVTNNNNETFFDMAIQKKQREVCLAIIAHERWQEALNLSSSIYRTPLLGLIENLPECVQMMVKFGQTDNLSHPLCEMLLRYKWLSYGFPLHVIQLCFYLLFTVTLSYFSITFNSCNHLDPFSLTNTKNISYCPNPLFTSFNETVSMHYQWEAGACSVFSAWFTLLFLIGRFDMYGIYVIMFLEIMKTLLHVLVLFSILIIGFVLTFCVLRQFSPILDPSKSKHLLIIIIKSITMMLGGLDYDRQYVEPMLTNNDNQHFPTITLIFLVLFTILMPILLMNLLVGLAIGDLMEIKQNARLKRLAMQVQLHTYLEKKFPKKMLNRLVKNEYVIYINKQMSYNILSRTRRQWISKPFGTKKSLENSDKLYQNNGLFIILYEQKLKQKYMQRQLQKLMNLVRLIVLKMNIHSKADIDDVHNTGPISLEKLQQIILTVKKFSYLSKKN